MVVVPLFSKHMWRHTLCLNIINTAKIMHLGQSFACNQDYENLGFLFLSFSINGLCTDDWKFIQTWSWLCSCFLTYQFFLPCKSDWFLILPVALAAKGSVKLWLQISKLCWSSFRSKILTLRHFNCKFSAHFNDSLFWSLVPIADHVKL